MKDQFDLFKYYYHNIFCPDSIVLPETKFRHFRFRIFSNAKNRFQRLRDIVESREHLFEKISRIIPKDAYFTPTKWLNPIYVAKTRKEIDVMLSSPLYFDIDSDLLNPPTLKQARDTTQALIDFIDDKFERSPDLVVFSGRRGFHVHYWDWNTQRITRMHPTKRMEYFIKERQEITDELAKQRIVVDEKITLDPYRIIRIPNTLHGKTGLIAKPIEDLKSFKPINSALAFERKYYNKIMKIDLASMY